MSGFRQEHRRSSQRWLAKCGAAETRASRCPGRGETGPKAKVV